MLVDDMSNVLVTVLLLTSTITNALAQIDTDSEPDCCLRGSQLAEETKGCRFSSNGQTQTCVGHMRRCCRKKLNEWSCLQGRHQAVSKLACDELDKNPTAEDCCNACKDGLTATTCSASWLEGDQTLFDTFKDCCEFATSNSSTGVNVDHPRQKRTDLKPSRCREGTQFNKDTGSCEDIDECALGKYRCPIDTFCVNTVPGYECTRSTLQREEIIPTCEAGQIYSKLYKDCIDEDECISGKNTCSENEVCMNILGGFRCRSKDSSFCEAGYTFQKGLGCVDNDECQSAHSCGNEVCLNQGGTYLCVPPCSEGLRIDPAKIECADIDECRTGNHTCSEFEECINTLGSYRCEMNNAVSTCNYGFRRNEFGNCEDIDECKEYENPCRPESTCVNTNGTFACLTRCGSGFKHVNGTCLDIDECQHGKDLCLKGQRCENTEGAYKCVDVICEDVGKVTARDGTCLFKKTCLPGFYQDLEDGDCVDVDECASQHPACASTETCINTVGSYFCRTNVVQCQEGMRRTPDGSSCLNINECIEKLHNCRPEVEQCVDLHGTFECVCSTGYQRNEFNECVKLGSSQCSPGFQYIDGKCSDINECSSYIPHACEGKCVNTIGSYYCECGEGLEADRNGHCVDIDECKRGLCRGECRNTHGSFECYCPAGFNMAHGSCHDIDECKSNQHNCTANQSCVNLFGDFRCISLDCPDGYISDQRRMRCLNNSTCKEDDCELKPALIVHNHVPMGRSMFRKPVTVRVSSRTDTRITFSLRLEKVKTYKEGIREATDENFVLQTGRNSAKVLLRKALRGPQDVHYTLMAKVFVLRRNPIREELYKIIVWNFYLYVPEYDF